MGCKCTSLKAELKTLKEAYADKDAALVGCETLLDATQKLLAEIETRVEDDGK